jgi:hypothetical protein
MPHQTRLFKYLQEIGIKSPYKVTKTESEQDDNVKIQLNSFNGQECLIILKEIDFVEIFPKEKYT